MKSKERKLLWEQYKTNVACNRQYSLRECGIDVGEQSAMHFVSVEQADEEAQLRVHRLVLAWDRLMQASDAFGVMEDERKILELSLEFLVSADKVRTERFMELLDLGVPVNFQHPQFLETAMHITCSSNYANALTEQLLKHPEIDLLLRDQFGRRAWNNTVFFDIDSNLSDRVLATTIKQAEAEGQSQQEFHREYREDLSKWIASEWYETLVRHKGVMWKPQF